MRLAVRSLLIVAFLASCRARIGADLPPAEERVRQVAENRREKDAYFLSDKSPLSDSLRRGFTGLSYFPDNPAYRFRVRLTPYAHAREVSMMTSKGWQKHYIEFGYVDFEVADTSRRLNVYKANPPIPGHENFLFIPFADATTGRDSYHAGRYLDLEENAEGRDYWLDFNDAYNPWCAYSDGYNCPYPPRENRLAIPIPAGEKNVPWGR